MTISSVRCKMTHNGVAQRGDKGAQIYMNAVYEGGGELQKISENAIFGEATPCANLALHGDFPVEAFQERDEEFYIDIYAVDAKPARGDFILCFPARKSYQHYDQVNGHYQFRFAPLGEVHGDLSMYVHNPVANAWLVEHDDVVVVIRLARGRRTDREIELRQKQLDDALVSAGEQWERNAEFHKKNNPDLTREEYVENWVRGHRRKLARAKGEL